LNFGESVDLCVRLIRALQVFLAVQEAAALMDMDHTLAALHTTMPCAVLITDLAAQVDTSAMLMVEDVSVPLLL
jgi:hypothetical protein